MPRHKLYIAIAASVIFAIPLVTFVSALVIFPLFFYGFLALFANFGPIALAIATGIEKLGMRVGRNRLYETWAYCGIMWIGCAYGLARWGDAAQLMGARNQPYFKVLFAPYVYLFGGTFA